MRERDDEVRRSFRLSEHAPDVDRDVEDEIALHLEMRARELRAEGHSPAEAERLAREAFGDREDIASRSRRLRRAKVRRGRAWEIVASVIQDLRFGARALLRAPMFAAVAVLTLALGIGANALVFSLVEAVLLRAPAVRSPETLLAIYTTCRRGDLRCASSYPDILDYRERTTSLRDLAGYVPQQLTLADGAGAQMVSAELAMGNLFEVLGVGAARGRPLVPSDDRAGGGERVVVLSHAFWQGRFVGDPDVVGRTLRLNGLPYTVVGIAQRGFRGLRLGAGPDVWVPLQGLPALFPSAVDASLFEGRDRRWIGGLVGRMAEGATLERVRAELLAVSAQLAQEYPAERGPRTVTVDPLPRYVLPDRQRESIVSFMTVLQAMVAFTLLLACANLANLLLARGTVRRRELGLRAAIGAGRGRIVRQLLTESLLLAAVGAAAGIALAWIALRLVSGFELPFASDVSSLRAGVNARVAGFTALLALATVVGFGTVPALQTSRGDLAGSLREGRTGGGPRSGRALAVLVGVQVALCVLLLSGAGLFLRTLAHQLRTDLGFAEDGVAVMIVDPSMNAYEPAAVTALMRDFTTRAASLPGVVSATAGTRLPLSGGGSATIVRVHGYEPAPDEELRVEFAYIGPDFFRTMRLPLLRGREFTPADATGARRVMVVNDAMARAWWPGRDALGGTVRFRGEDYTVVGVARDAAWQTLEDAPYPLLFVPLAQDPGRVAEATLAFLVRSDRAMLDALLPRLRSELARVDPDLAISSLGTMQERVARTLAAQRGTAVLLGAFGALALALASVGIYGVVAYGVSQRRRDFGIRMALGARAAQVTSLVARGMALPVALGTAAGLAGVAMLGPAARDLMRGVGPRDPLALGGAVLILLLAAAAATLIPARRAARAHPADVLRTD